MNYLNWEWGFSVKRVGALAAMMTNHWLRSVGMKSRWTLGATMAYTSMSTSMIQSCSHPVKKKKMKMKSSTSTSAIFEVVY